MERDFIINIGSLAPGINEFEFEVGEKFFQKFENSIIEKGNIDVLVVVEKKDNLLQFDFTMEGKASLPCDRCLEELELNLQGYNELIVKIGEQNEELSETIIMISSKEHEIDVAQYIYEFITLMIPMRNVHDEKENGQKCDPEILKEIEKHLTHDAPEVDPRWDALKKINLN